MYRLNEVIEIDRKFQNSVNLSIDLENEKKVKSYIPTRSSTVILEQYLENVEKGVDKATILIGPYGKGKSHLLLVLLDRLRRQKKPFLPVIVSGTHEDLNQAFLMGIIDGLKRAGLEDIAPDSYYSKAVDTIALWKENYPLAYQMFLEEISNQEYTEENYIAQLKRLNEKTLSNFRKIYPKITNGSEFQPIVELETTKIYQEINRVLQEKYKYTGMFIVFDEFSKYIEGHRLETFAKDMKVLQDMCELANSYKGSQMHITFVAHKSIKEYGTALPKEMIHAFTGVEGRLKEIQFVVSSQNNYELIENVIQKKIPDYTEYIRENMPYFKNATKSHELQIFDSLFVEKDFQKIIVEGCYPLLPVTVYLLLAISEKVAQNERSIFTFLANDEKGSLYRLVQDKADEIQSGGVTADVVYDYFANLFREETGLVHIHTEWLKADYALSKTTDIPEQKVIKVMALLLMLHREEAPVEENILCRALHMSKETFTEVMESLKEKQIVAWKPKSASYAFRNNVGVDLEKEIKEVMAKMPAQLNLAEHIREISELDYILPKQHNQEYTISRFFEYVYMTEEQFFKLPDSEYLFTEHFSDGKLVALLIDEKADAEREKELQKKVEALADQRVVTILPYIPFRGKEFVRRYIAIQKLLQNKEFLEENKVLEQELKNSAEDIQYEINQLLKQSFLPEENQCMVFYGKDVYRNGFRQEMTFNGFLSTICKRVYEKTPKVNNELINRQNISAQNKKARKKIVEMILTEESEEVYSRYETGTGPEATIYRATMLQTGIRGGSKKLDRGCKQVLDEIDVFISECDGQKLSFRKLYNRLMGEGYGARRGILPIYIANQLVQLQDTPVVYLGEREVELSAEIFENINEQPGAYYLFVEHETAQKQQYLQLLEDAFCKEKSEVKKDSRRKRLGQIAENMHRWYRSLPQITMNFKVCPSYVKEEEFHKLVAFRKLFRQMELNPRELLFEKIPQIFESKEYQEIAEQILQIKEILDGYFEEIQKEAIQITKAEFKAGKEESLSVCLTQWYERQSQTAKTFLSNSRVTGFIQYTAQIDTYDEKKIIGRIAKIVLDTYVEDWRDDALENYKKALHETRQEIEAIRQSNEQSSGKNHLVFTNSKGDEVERFYDQITEDSTSYFLQNAIEDALDEFGDALETNQKVAVLMQALERLISR